MEQTVEINSVATVLRELAPLIDEVQHTLEQGLEGEDPTAATDGVAARLNEIRGTLQLLELEGPSLLVNEMRVLAMELSLGRVEVVAPALEVLLKAVFRLPDYLDRLQAGHADRPAVLLPLLNELRAARGADPLDERAVFRPRLEPAGGGATRADDSDIRERARRLRPRFQKALLGWYRGQDVTTALGELGAVLGELSESTGNPATGRLWRVCGALTESLADQGLDGDQEVKVLMGKVERLLSQLVRQGEDALERTIPLDLLRSLLYYVARSGSDSPRVREIKEAYDLDELLPGSDVQADFEGPNRGLLEVVGEGIRDELAGIRDAVEIYVHSDERRPDVLEGLPARLAGVADTFSMLGLPEDHDTLQREADALAGVAELEPADAEQRMQQLADVLLRVDSDLSDLQSGRPRAGDAGALAIRALPDSEYRPLLSAVVQAALEDLSKAREAIGVYCSDPDADTEAVSEVPALLTEVHGAAQMLPLGHVQPLMRDLTRYIERELIGGGRQPSEDAQILIADVVAGVEYYLEAVDHDRAGMTHLLESATRAMAALDSGGTPQIHAEDEQVVIESADGPAEGLSEDELARPGESPGDADAGSGADRDDVAAAAETGTVDFDTGEPGPGPGEAAGAGAGATTEGLDVDLGEVAPEAGAGDEAERGETPDPDAPLDLDLGAGEAETSPWEETEVEESEIRGADVPELDIEAPGGREPGDAAPGADDVTGPGTTAPEHDPPQPEAPQAEAPQAQAPEPDVPEPPQPEAREPEVPEPEAPEPETPAPARADGAGPEDADAGTREEAAATPPDDTGPGGVDVAASGSRYAIVGADVDDDIVEVFIEEALGELDKINEHLPAWKADPGHEEALIVIRRAFHTLKGGGRLLGAELIGEFAWSMENMLNRVIDRSIDATQAVFDTLDESSTALPQLIEQIRGNQAPIDGIDDLIERAHALSRGEEPPPGGGGPSPVSSGGPRGGAGSDPGDAAGARSGGPDGVSGSRVGRAAADTDTGAGAAASDAAGPAPADPGASPGEPGAPVAGDAARADGGDPLLAIFAREAEGHQAVLRAEYVDDADREPQPRPVSEDVRRALHTLVGSAQTAGCDEIAELAGQMEAIVKARREAEANLTADEVRLFRETIVTLDRLIADLGGEPAVDTREIRERLDTRRQEVVSEIEGAQGEGENELLDIFLEEGDELLEACDRAVARWRESPEDPDVVSDLQRSLHTLKGGARMAGFPPIADLTHEVESMINAIDDGSCRLDDDVFELLQEAVDALTVLLEQARGRQTVARVDWLVEDLRDLRERNSEPAAAGAASASDAGTAASGAEDVPVEAAPPEAAEPPAAPAATAEAADDDSARRGRRWDDAEPAMGAGAGATRAQPGSDQVRVQSELLDNLVNFAGEVSIYHSRLGEQMGQYRFNLNEFEQTVSRLRNQLRTMENETESQILHRHEKEQQDAPRRADFDPLEFDRYTRIQELSRSLAESVGDLDSIKEILENLTRDAETLLLQQSRVSSELQDGLMQTRMVRFDGLRARLSRIVRQTAAEVGKKAQLAMSGGELEVDRSILERVVAPLEHVLRNAVSHGIESPAERQRAGKPEQGTIRLDLHRGGTDIVIDISDDGAGIDPDAVRRKGIERGLIDADDELDDNEVIKLILETGFSTASEVTQISGRGVGMDVVDAEVRRLGGSLGIHTRKGAGSRFTVRLPVTLAINQAVLVQAGEDTYAIPIASIEGVTQVTAGNLREHYVDPSKPFTYASNDYRVEHLGSLLGTSEPRLDNNEVSYPVIMIRAGDDRVALHVDQLLGRREVVVKPLGAPLNMLAGISGATIMADGEVVLILDLGGLLRTEGRFVAAEPAAEEAAEADAESSEDKEPAPTVLVVDDSITIRKVTQRILARNGINVATAKDGVDALSWMSQTVPDLILLDIEMPRMDGYEVATYVKGEDRLKQVPIIMITSRTGDKHRQRAEDIGVDHYLGKPYQEAELMEHIQALIRTPAAA